MQRLFLLLQLISVDEKKKSLCLLKSYGKSITRIADLLGKDVTAGSRMCLPARGFQWLRSRFPTTRCFLSVLSPGSSAAPDIPLSCPRPARCRELLAACVSEAPDCFRTDNSLWTKYFQSWMILSAVKILLQSTINGGCLFCLSIAVIQQWLEGTEAWKKNHAVC